MARPSTISVEQILDAARAVFLQKGIHATTREIAQQAGIAESSIFYRFPTKEALFREAMMTAPVPPWVQELDTLAGTGDPHENLLHIARELIAFAQQMLPMFLLSYGSGPLAQNAEIHPGKRLALRDRERTVRYMQQEIALGRLRDGDAEVMASVLFGSCVGFIMDALALKCSRTPEEIETFAQRLVSLLWQGIAPLHPDSVQGDPPDASHPVSS